MVSKSDELTTLCCGYKANGDPRLFDLILEKAFPQVEYLAGRVLATIPKGVVTPIELYSAGNLGVLDALTRFDPSRGVRFGTMLSRRITGSMIDYLRECDSAPRKSRTRVKKFIQRVREVHDALGRKPSQYELMRALKLTGRELFNLQRECEELSIRSLSGPVKEHGLRHPRRENSTTETTVFSRSAAEQVMKSVHVERERQILRLYYFESLTMKEIGRRLQLSESRVCYIHRKLLKRLRKELIGAAYAP